MSTAPSFLPVVLIPIFFLLAVWTSVWKAIALWHAARRGEKVWYVVLLLVNTLGILELIYIYVIAKRPVVSPATSEVNKIQ